jgi:hypothetical protein
MPEPLPRPPREDARALAAGLAYLATQQEPDGSFLQFKSRTRTMTERRRDASVFATIQILHSLSGIAHPAAVGLRAKAAGFVLGRMEPVGLWRYWPGTVLPVDLDDTACASACLGPAHPWLLFRQNVPALLANRNRAGLFKTWIHRDLDNVDCVVNANVVWYLGASAGTRAAMAWIRDLLVAGREADLATSYYDDPFSLFYAVSRAIAAGVHEWRPLGALMKGKVLARYLDQGGDLPSLLLAQALVTLCAAGDRTLPLTRGIASQLLHRQGSDGSWPIWPWWSDVTLSREGLATWWGSPALTTAVCLEALTGLADATPGPGQAI